MKVEQEIKNYNDSFDFEIHYNQSIWYGGRDKTTVQSLSQTQVSELMSSSYFMKLLKHSFQEHKSG